MPTALLFFKSFFGFFLKNWKIVLPVLIVSGIFYVIYTQKLQIADLTTDLIATQHQLDQVKDLYATQSALNAVKEDIAMSNALVLRRVNNADRKASESLRAIEEQVRTNGSEVDKLTMQLNKDVADFIDQTIKERGYHE